MPPSLEDFIRWREDRVTRWIFTAIMAGVRDQESAWMKASWENGACSEALLRVLRTRADAYMALIETEYEGWCEMNGDEPSD